jgi:YihY family inner membrane protein
MLEQAVAAIFHTTSQGAHRHFLVSALLPYLFILVMGVTLFLLTFLTSTLDLLTQLPTQFMALDLSVQPVTSALLWVASGLGLVLMFTGIYWVLPVVKISPKRALIGGLCATGLWLLVARFLVYYFANISMVSVIYGSLATTVVLLLFMEVAFIILLLGAQVIAELQAAAVDGKRWWGGSDPAPSPGPARPSDLGRG